MFVGHLAVALGAKRAAPRVPLAALVGASFGIDLLWPLLLFAGVEVVRVDPGNTAFTPLAFDSYPWSHSLAMVLVWAVIGGVLVASRVKTSGTALVVGLVIVSHWVLDVITHRPDLPLWPGGPLVGLGLWRSVPATLVVEGAMLAAGIELYRRAFPPRSKVGQSAFWSLIVFTTAIWVSGPWSPPPPSATAVAAVALALWLLPPWAAAIDRHRGSR